MQLIQKKKRIRVNILQINDLEKPYTTGSNKCAITRRDFATYLEMIIRKNQRNLWQLKIQKNQMNHITTW